MNSLICPQASKCTVSARDCDHKEPHEFDEDVCLCSRCKDAPDQEASVACVPFREHSKIAQVRVIMGNHWGACYITFRTQFHIENDLGGKTFRNPSAASLNRLSRLLFLSATRCFVDHLNGEILFGDLTPLPDLFSWTAKKDRAIKRARVDDPWDHAGMDGE